MTTRQELDALRQSQEVRNFLAQWRPLGGRTYSEGCRGVVDMIGAPADPDVVIIRDVIGKRHRWSIQHVSVS
ncbi:hypothetical protein [Streptomyces mirabilis]|uniref:hypothetical protein n=1 Tax=Streptomyces mirabilis TaxID=68239 RepID=UPI0036D86BD5